MAENMDVSDGLTQNGIDLAPQSNAQPQSNSDPSGISIETGTSEKNLPESEKEKDTVSVNNAHDDNVDSGNALSESRKKVGNSSENDMDIAEKPAIQSKSLIGAEYRDQDGGINIDGIYIAPPPPPSLTFETEGPRLVITHIENENFKSYAGLQVLGPFHKSFTSIVGPNGSGKSNVIDSMLFVFGYRAQKIRSKKISVLIHDSENHPNIRSCKVKVHFQEIIDEGEDNFRVVPDTHVVVARTAFKDNSSFYELNGRRCQYKEIAHSLRKQGIDLDHNRFLILQGEVEQIALMKPKGLNENDEGMLEYLEDIIGSSRFKDPIETLHKRVQELDEHRTEKLNRVKLVEKEKDELEKPKNEALEYLNLNNKIVRKKNMGYQQYVMSYEKRVEITKGKKQEYEEKVKEQLAQVEEVTAKKTAKEEKYKSMQKEMERLQKDTIETQENFSKFELEDAKIREEMKNMNAKRKKLIGQSKLEKEKAESFSKVPEKNQGKIDECEELKEKYQRQVVEEQETYDKALESLKAETQVFQDQKEKLETELIGFTKIENEKEANLNLAQSEVDVLTQNEQKEKLKLEQLEQRLIRSNTELEEKQAQLKDNEKVLPNLIKSTEKHENELKEVTANYEAMNGRCRTTRANFEETRTAQNASKGRGAVLDALMRQRTSGAIPGIYGRLGDLGAIDKKYDVAVSTLGGGSLETIIVDSTETAKECINYIKKHNIGRGNFYALEKAEAYQQSLRRQFRAPENAPRMVDLINLPEESEKFRLAFYHYFRDSLVAEDLSQANRIAYGAQRYQVITLNGELISTSGAMTGGGNPQRGKMGTQVQRVDETDLKTLERELHKQEKEASLLSEKRLELDQIVHNARKEILQREKSIKALRLQINKLIEEKKLLDQQIQSQKPIVKNAKPDKGKFQELQNKVEKLKIEFEEAIEKSRDKKDAVQKLNKKIKEFGGNKVKSAQSKLDGTKNQLDKVNKEITRLKVEIKSAEREHKKSKEKCDNLDSEVQEAENKMREMKKERENLEKEGGILVEKLAELKEAETIGKDRIAHTKESLAKLEAEVNKYKSDRIEIDQQNNKYEEAIREETKNIKHWKREITKLQLEDIPGEEIEELRNYFNDEEGILELEQLSTETWQYELNMMEEEFSSKRPDLGAIEEYKRKESIYLERVAELDEMTKKKEEQRKLHDNLRKMRLNEFMEGFGIITAKLKEMYQMITLGGDAELELVDSLDPFTEGIVFSVRPPKKSWKNISNLSGGEKTLSSLALVFALHYYKPTPLYVMDEIDAALDFKNVSIIANYIKERTKNAQFIIISLRSNMFELADRLVGIYKTYNCTKSVSINPGKIGQIKSS